MEHLVYVGRKARRGVVGDRNPTIPGVLNINATSGSMNKIAAHPAKSFSPMILGPVIESEIFGKGEIRAENFENYWQYGKVFRELGHIDAQNMLSEKWYQFRAKGYA